MSTIETLGDAIAAYARRCQEDGVIYDQPSNDSDYEPGRGWVLENVRGELAVVRDDGSFGETLD
jgi:hypothetical protein